MKSSIKTFLAGKNPYYGNMLKNSKSICDVCAGDLDLDAPLSYYGGFYDQTERTYYYTDVLDDGTAITYCKDE